MNNESFFDAPALHEECGRDDTAAERRYYPIHSASIVRLTAKAALVSVSVKNGNKVTMDVKVWFPISQLVVSNGQIAAPLWLINEIEKEIGEKSTII